MQVPAPVQDGVYVNVRTDHLIDDSIGFEVNFPKVRDADPLQLGWDMAPPGQLNQALAQRFDLLENIGRVFRLIVERDVGVDIDQVLLGVLKDPDAAALHSTCALMRLRMSVKAFLTGLLRPSCRLLVLWDSILSSASDSWVCS